MRALRVPAGEKPSQERIVAASFGPWLVLALLLVAVLALASLLVGARPIAPSIALDALFSYDASSPAHIIVRDYRLPRTLLALLCGAAFGVSGALIQAATRNPLADPGILGVNAGAAFFVTVAVGLLGWQTIDAYLWAAFLGAIVVTLAVYALGAAGRVGATPVRMVLSGVALSAVLGGIGSAVTLLDPQAFDALRMWSIGSVAGRDMHIVAAVAPFIVAGLVIALAAARPLNAVVLGDSLARALGADVLRARIIVVIAVTLLSGAGTAAAGPIGFIGLMVPHVVRWLTGPDQHRIIPLTMVFGPVLLLVADIVGRLVLHPGEIEAGIVTAFLGAPVLILLARRGEARGL
ncbi:MULTISPECIES: iron chelate uptake ABC transporter family permease subunit [unclassified Shinella]|uniref:FecCD family ABC transporter permease n=1 Tax=unclassified Shinella TaxID=2643062 RepID=UPI00225D3B96|nr:MULTISPECIES: iron chelate uptake ABC transporter family permease subunit [unclassified Shinella]MCO5140164.1 iron chelate uptake ABC transporter family permease subunit [Shinella sp.]MDC7256818.1 iron chelate uptake ABC transporter family permease subunit [Shinella sp. YE25]CAI0339702.1 ferric enterobactin ABC transporter membrane subunit FebD [Rhizobiaceae bacterium]CAK7258094.1 ferric enterobactin ABC transporter membrane subunit FebD [Shinella sp. WSC3-e]